GAIKYASRPRRRLHDADVFADALDFPENRIQRVFEGAIDRVALRRAELVEVRLDAAAGVHGARPVRFLEISRDLLARKHRLRDVVEHQSALGSSLWTP